MEISTPTTINLSVPNVEQKSNKEAKEQAEEQDFPCSCHAFTKTPEFLNDVKKLMRYQYFHDHTLVFPMATVDQFSKQTFNFMQRKTNGDSEFSWSPLIEANFIANMVYQGFLPMAMDIDTQALGGRMWFLTPKLHKQRCLLQFEDRKINQRRKLKSLGKHCVLTVNRAYERVVKHCHEQHGESWLHVPLVKCFQEMAFQYTHRSDKPDRAARKVDMFSIELWRKRTASSSSSSSSVASSSASSSSSSSSVASADHKHGDEDEDEDERGSPILTEEDVDGEYELIAGELGYCVGSVYTSMSGFRTVNHSGSVQIQALCSLLQDCGCAFWDLGMHMQYKEDFGCKNVAREEFLAMLHSCRDDYGFADVLRGSGGRHPAGELISRYLSSPVRGI